MKSPFYKIWLDEKKRIDITESITSLHFEDCLGKDNLIQLRGFDDYGLSLLNGPNLITGKKLLIQFGFIGGVVSEVHKAQIRDLDVDYDDRVTFTIVALDQGAFMKKQSGSRVWKNKTSTQIAEEIAEKYGMQIELYPTTKVWPSMPQGQRNDFEFLHYLAHRETDGNYIFYIRNDTLHFVRTGLDKYSIYNYTYGENAGSIMHLTTRHRESTQEAGAIDSSTAFIDPVTKKITGISAGNKTEKGAISLGNYKHLFDEADNETGAVAPDGIFGSKSAKGTKLVVPAENQQEASDIVNSHHKKSKHKIAEASLYGELNPLLKINEIITVKGTAKRHEGNWYIRKVIHSIEGRNAETTAELSRNGNKKIGDDATNVNKSVGKSADSKKVVLKLFDANNSIIADVQKSGQYVAPAKEKNVKGAFPLKSTP